MCRGDDCGARERGEWEWGVVMVLVVGEAWWWCGGVLRESAGKVSVGKGWWVEDGVGVELGSFVHQPVHMLVGIPPPSFTHHHKIMVVWDVWG